MAGAHCSQVPGGEERRLVGEGFVDQVDSRVGQEFTGKEQEIHPNRVARV